MLLKLGSKGKDVEYIQYYLGLKVDGDFGPKTESAIKDFQKQHGLKVDGVVGSNTWNLMKQASTDNFENTYTTSNGLIINKYYLPKKQF